MQITIAVYKSGRQPATLFTVDISPETTVSALRDTIEVETGATQASQNIYYNGFPMADGARTIQQYRVTDGDMLYVHIRNAGSSSREEMIAPQQPQQQPQQQRQQPPNVSGGTDPELIRLDLLGDPSRRQQLSYLNPQLAEALDDSQLFASRFNEAVSLERRARNDRQREIERLNADPFDIEAQAKIEEMIRQERVMENLQNAMEHTPEVFGRVHMLYIDVEVNKHKMKALVDSGAQATIMSPACAEACGIMRLVDRRYAGIARGVGTANIIGRVHATHVRIGSLHLPCSFTVMEGKSVDMLLGLDMLKRHQACIDLIKDKLIIRGVEIPFLGEADIPREIEEAVTEEPRLPGPSGTTIGQRSGAILPAEQDTAAGVSSEPVAATTSTGPTPPAASASGAGTARQGVSTEQVEQLMAMGASRETAANALLAAEGDLEVAAGLLFFSS